MGGCAGELILNQTAFHASQELVAQCARAGPRQAGRLGASSEVEWIKDTQRKTPRGEAQLTLGEFGLLLCSSIKVCLPLTPLTHPNMLGALEG